MIDGRPLGSGTDTKPILLYDDECAVCRRIAAWVRKASKNAAGETRLIVRPIGSDPAALRLLNARLSIWDAYATIHLLMPDGSMQLGGEAVAEVLRRLPATRSIARSFSVRIFGWRPCQAALDLGYLILSDARPLFGCESCGTAAPWVRPFVWLGKRLRSLAGDSVERPHLSPHPIPSGSGGA